MLALISLIQRINAAIAPVDQLVARLKQLKWASTEAVFKVAGLELAKLAGVLLAGESRR